MNIYQCWKSVNIFKWFTLYCYTTFYHWVSHWVQADGIGHFLICHNDECFTDSHVLYSFVPFKSSFTSWSLFVTACATARAASSVISQKDRLSSCTMKEYKQNKERDQDMYTCSLASSANTWLFCGSVRARLWSTPWPWGLEVPLIRFLRSLWPQPAAPGSLQSLSPGYCGGVSGPVKDTDITCYSLTHIKP